MVGQRGAGAAGEDAPRVVGQGGTSTVPGQSPDERLLPTRILAAGNPRRQSLRVTSQDQNDSQRPVRRCGRRPSRRSACGRSRARHVSSFLCVPTAAIDMHLYDTNREQVSAPTHPRQGQARFGRQAHLVERVDEAIRVPGADRLTADRRGAGMDLDSAAQRATLSM